MSIQAWPLLFSAGTPHPPPPVLIDRPPLPPFDPDSIDEETGAPLPVYTALREAPPTNADPRWWRGDAWGMTLPDLPLVPGGAATGGAASRVLTYFLGRYDRAAGTTGNRRWERAILDRHRAYPYTHISLSPQDEFADGMTEDEYVAMSVRCREAGLFVHHLMRSKYYTPAAGTVSKNARNPFLNLLKARCRQPQRPGDRLSVGETATATPASMPDLDVPNRLIERLLSEGAMQIETPAWEMNYWSPAIVRAMIDHDSDLIGTRCLINLHFYPHYISWQENDETPTDFWRANYGRVDGLCYQCDPYWTAGMMAARVTDGLDRLGPGGLWGLGYSGRGITPEEPSGHPIDYVVWETVATCQYNNLHDGDDRPSDEETGNLKGFECGNAPGQLVARGFGNGGRRPDGTPL